MVSLILYAALALVVAAVVVSVLVVVLPDDTVSAAERDRVPTGLPAGRSIAADDLGALRLPVGLRGYRMADTDAVLDRLGAELAERDAEIARLRGGDVPLRGSDAPPRGSGIAEPVDDAGMTSVSADGWKARQPDRSEVAPAPLAAFPRAQEGE